MCKSGALTKTCSGHRLINMTYIDIKFDIFETEFQIFSYNLGTQALFMVK